ncbi:MAG: hypothetical protein ABWZ40_07880 [Caulobacterales bacterium]
MHRHAGHFALIAALAVAGCATRPASDAQAFAKNTGRNSFEFADRKVKPQDTLVLPVIHDRQTEGPSCGAHALASLINYWRGPGTIVGSELYRAQPPVSPSGYSMAELMTLAAQQNLLASAVSIPEKGLIAELEKGRPVLIPVRLPSIYVQQVILPGGDVPVLGTARNFMISRAAKASEWSKAGMVDHYLLVVGYEPGKFVVVEPVMGYRTITAEKLERYRAAFQDAALVFSAEKAPSPTS